MKLSAVFVVFAVCPFCILAADGRDFLVPRTNSTDVVLSRRRRYLDFLQSSRVFCRANIKENVFTFGSLWAFAQGYKASSSILNNMGTRPFRRDAYTMVQHMMDLHGFDGQACLLNLFCTVTRDADGHNSGGFLFKLLRHVFNTGYCN